jgi:hypothetical protein
MDVTVGNCLVEKVYGMKMGPTEEETDARY